MSNPASATMGELPTQVALLKQTLEGVRDRVVEIAADQRNMREQLEGTARTAIHFENAVKNLTQSMEIFTDRLERTERDIAARESAANDGANSRSARLEQLEKKLFSVESQAKVYIRFMHVAMAATGAVIVKVADHFWR